jgi:2-keto-4-pentenoate hydratase/2-oxohepta-3-ene-1,7-dioic acid hydratase in catechol pathway
MNGTYHLATFRVGAGSPRAGLVLGDRIFDAAEATGEPAYADSLAILDDWARAEARLQAAAAKPAGSGTPLTDVALLPPILRPGAIYCAAANYRDHVRNMAKKLGIPDDPDPHELGIMPYHFMKPPRAARRARCSRRYGSLPGVRQAPRLGG